MCMWCMGRPSAQMVSLRRRRILLQCRYIGIWESRGSIRTSKCNYKPSELERGLFLHCSGMQCSRQLMVGCRYDCFLSKFFFLSICSFLECFLRQYIDSLSKDRIIQLTGSRWSQRRRCIHLSREVLQCGRHWCQYKSVGHWLWRSKEERWFRLKLIWTGIREDGMGYVGCLSRSLIVWLFHDFLDSKRYRKKFLLEFVWQTMIVGPSRSGFSSLHPTSWWVVALAYSKTYEINYSWNLFLFDLYTQPIQMHH